MFPNEARNKPATANLPAGFHPAQHDEQITPRRRERFASQQVAEDNAPAVEELRGKKLGACGASPFEQGPAAGGMARTGHTPATFASPALRIYQRPEVLKTVGCHQTGCHQLPD